MTRNIIAFIIVIITSTTGFSQTENCGTPKIDSADAVSQPYYGNNEFLLNLADSIEGMPNGRVIPVILRIPVTAWVWMSNTDNLLDDNEVERYINFVNQVYINNNVNIRLYLRCQINRNINNTWYNGVNGSNYDDMFNQNYSARTLNIHFVSNSDASRGRFPWKNNPYACYITTFGVFNNRSATTLTHEIGHSLGLLHTHENARGANDPNAVANDCFQEPVSRTRSQGIECLFTVNKTKCSINGDMLCDTDADPQLFQIIGGTNIFRTDGNCNFIEVGSDDDYIHDNWGDRWLPQGLNNATRNVMSYSLNGFTDCRTQLTPMQRGVQYFYTLYRAFPVAYQFESFYRNEDVDNFENDNFFQNANNINLNAPQSHSFHLVPDQNSNYTGCDVDWVRFIPTCSGSFTVQTSAITGRTNANTRLTLFDAAQNQLAQNDDISPSNQFSSITLNLVAGQTYFIRVDNMSANVTGYYNLNVSEGFAITGSENVCSSGGTYSINGLPNGTSVSWSTNPIGYATFNPNNQTPTTVTSNQNEVFTLIATFTSPCSGLPITVTKEVTGGTPIPTIQYVTYYGQEVSLTALSIPGATYNWYEDGVLTEAGTGNSYITTVPCNTTKFIQVEAVNTCGTSIKAGRGVSVRCSTGGAFSLAPNPASSNLTISVNKSVDKTNTQTSTEIQEVRITDKLGNLKIINKYSKGTKLVNINIASLKSDMYVVQIFNGNNWDSQQLVIQH